MAARSPVRTVFVFLLTIVLIVTKACLLFATKDVMVLGLLQGGGGFCCGANGFVDISNVVCHVGRGTTNLTDVYVLDAKILLLLSVAISLCFKVNSVVIGQCPFSASTEVSNVDRRRDRRVRGIFTRTVGGSRIPTRGAISRACLRVNYERRGGNVVVKRTCDCSRSKGSMSLCAVHRSRCRGLANRGASLRSNRVFT